MIQTLLQHTPEWWMAVIGLVGFLGWGLKQVAIVLHRAWRLAPVLSSADRTLAELKQGIDAIKKEVAFNGGGSLKDAVTRVEQQVVQNNADLKDQTTTLTKQIRNVQAAAIMAQRKANKNSQRIQFLQEEVARKS